MSDADKVFFVFANSNLFRDKQITLSQLKTRINSNSLTISEFIEIAKRKQWYTYEFERLQTQGIENV